VGLAVAVGVTSVEPPTAAVFVAVSGIGETTSVQRQYNSVLDQTRQRSVNDAIGHLRERLSIATNDTVTS